MNLFDSGAGLPYASALRVFQPLEAFGNAQQRFILDSYPMDARLGGAQPGHPSGHESASYQAPRTRDEVEQLDVNNALQRLLRDDSDPYPGQANEVVRRISHPGNTGEYLYCPNQAVLRSAVAAELLKEELPENQIAALIPEGFAALHSQRLQALVDAGHIESEHLFSRSSTWGVPYSWFIFFEEQDQAEVVAHHSGSIATVRVQVPIQTALLRAQALLAPLTGAEAELDFMEEFTRLLGWAMHFGPEGVIELDYGAAADAVFPDESPSDVRMGLESLAEGDMTGAAAAYHRLSTRWAPIHMLASSS